MQNCLHKEAFFEKCQQVENEVQRLSMQENFAGGAKILENVEFGEEQELHGEILGNRRPSLHFTQTKENSDASCSQQDRDYLNSVYQAEQEKKIVDAFCHLVKQQSAPYIELDVFDGNPLDFHYFVTPFNEIVEKRIDPREDWQDCSNEQVGMQKK